MLVKSIFFLIPILLSSEDQFKNPILLENFKTKVRIIENQTNKIIPIASLTKLYTIFFVKKSFKLDKEITISSDSPSNSINPKAAKFKKDEIYSSLNIIKAMIVTSSNQATLSLTESYFSSEKNFKIKANLFFESEYPNTYLEDSYGLSEKSVSNIEDISKLLDRIYLDKVFFNILELKESEIKTELGKSQILYSTIELNQINGFEIFGKTGSTKKAKKCFAGFLRKKKEIYKIIILSSENIYIDIAKIIKFIHSSS